MYASHDTYPIAAWFADDCCRPPSRSSRVRLNSELSRQVPLYLADDCSLVYDSTQRYLRSADVPTCLVPRTLSNYGDRTFAAGGPRLRNSLPVQLCNPDITYGLFRRQQLKGHLFRAAWTWRSVTSDMWRLRKTLTYDINSMTKFFLWTVNSIVQHHHHHHHHPRISWRHKSQTKLQGRSKCHLLG